MKQKRGCSRLVYATYTYTPAAGSTPAAITFGTVKEFAPVKSISRTLDQASEDVYADNKLHERTHGASVATRTFEVIGVPKAVEAEVMGQSVITVATTKKLTGTSQDGSTKPFIAIGYALHDGDVQRPCEVVWAFKALVNSISSVANTIDAGTGSDGQTVEVSFFAPDIPWTATGKADLDISLEITADTADDAETWFEQVVTYDNAATVLA